MHMCSTIDQARLSFSIQSQRRVTYIQMQADRRFRKSHHISPAIFSFTSSHQPPDAVHRLPEFIQAMNSSNSQSSRNLTCSGIGRSRPFSAFNRILATPFAHSSMDFSIRGYIVFASSYPLPSCLSCSIAFAILRILGSPAPTYFGSSTGWSPSCISFIHLVSGIGAPSGPSTHLFRKEHSRQQRSPGHLHVAQCIIRFVLVSQCTHLPQVQ